MSAVVQLTGLSRTYGTDSLAVAALRDVNLTVRDGEYVAVMGPSGSGKSTLLGILGGLDADYSGSARILDQEVRDLSRERLAALRRTGLGFVFQEFNLVPTLTVAENVSLPLELDGMPVRAARELALRSLARTGIEDLADRQVEQVSGGQRQRVAIARGIVGDRRLILADEPTGALDSATGDSIMELLRDLVDQGLSVVLVTHEARHAGWADRIVFIRDGQIIDEARGEYDPDSLLAGDR